MYVLSESGKMMWPEPTAVFDSWAECHDHIKTAADAKVAALAEHGVEARCVERGNGYAVKAYCPDGEERTAYWWSMKNVPHRFGRAGKE